MMLAAALDLAERGWPILPMHAPAAGGCSCGDTACKSPGKHPRITTGKAHAFASNDLDEVRQWWTRWPDANIGTPTGLRTGTVVLDIDPRHNGYDTLESLEQLNAPLPRTVESKTGSGGRHLLFAHPGFPITRASIGEGVDVRADGKLIVLPPSVHACGGEYRWLRHPDVCEMRDCPDWLLNLLRRKAAA